MPYAVAHIFAVIVLLEIFRRWCCKKPFSSLYLVIGGIAGVLPDIDIAFYYVLSFFGYSMGQVHRTFTHSLFFVLFFLVIGVFVWGVKSQKLEAKGLSVRNIFFVIAFGVIVHILLDALVLGPVNLLYPIAGFSFGFNILNIAPKAWYYTLLPSIDAVILVLWLAWVGLKERVQSFF